MITITFQKVDGSYQGFEAVGHAGYSPAGHDVVCAAVSALTQGCVLTLESMSRGGIELESREGKLRCRIREPDYVSDILVAGMDISITAMQNQYRDYINVCHG